jgi:hypothetical protein
MENFNGTMGGITGAILQAGVKPDTKIQLIVSLRPLCSLRHQTNLYRIK